MHSPERKQLLPHVEETDILSMVVEEVLDPTHKEWWTDFAETNNILARHVLMRAFHASREVQNDTSIDRQKAILDIVAFAMRTLAVASERITSPNQAMTNEQGISVGDGDGEDRQP